ncbi:hypothetical protein [Streptomyces ipomoeae]|uniref:hypothetical protein n=1 Tax=Streptomyces ipomoeae TaxID=103232 RepID=UPI0011462388|nr:hypothetical protein [Streptomyces ipomoeae]MDX2932381.1 hypothetical protein [Streptomyces ipomoeae]TQE27071.1 hypothetical protein SipoB123_12940 [Streptomyces ipomoeae]
MAQAAPTPGTPARRDTLTAGPTGRATSTAERATPDIFGERTHAVAHWALPAVLGLVYGYWAAAMNRDAGPITGWNILFGFATAFVFTVFYLAVRAVAPRLRRELHALLWAAFAGCAFGFLYSQASQHTVLRSAAMSLGVAAGLFAVLFYRYYTHEDAEGHRTR